jgi:hypothetical protein
VRPRRYVARVSKLRFLTATALNGYVDHPARALLAEPEAISEQQQEAMTRAAHER